MHIISRKILLEYYTQHTILKDDLLSWYDEVKHSEWNSPADIKARYASSSFLADNRVVFNIHGNACRLMVRVNYNSKTVFIKFIVTHAEYDKKNMEDL